MKPLKQVTAEAERIAIIEALKANGNNKSKTARELQIDRKTLYNKMQDFNIKPSTLYEKGN